jgi:hypothetical protein
MKDFTDLRNQINTLSSDRFNKAEIIRLIDKKRDTAINRMKEFTEIMGASIVVDGISAKAPNKVEEVRVGDVISYHIARSPHPCLIFKIDEEEDICYAAVMSTKHDKPHSVYPIEKSRIFKGSCISNTIIAVNKEQAIDSWLCIFDSPEELKECVKKLKLLYKKVLI